MAYLTTMLCQKIRALYKPRLRQIKSRKSKCEFEDVENGSKTQPSSLRSLPDSHRFVAPSSTHSVETTFKAPARSESITESMEPSDDQPAAETAEPEMEVAQSTHPLLDDSSVVPCLLVPGKLGIEPIEGQIAVCFQRQEDDTRGNGLDYIEDRIIPDTGEYYHIKVDENDSEDYTKGPAGLVLASDGIQKDCIALLLTPDLVAKIQCAIIAQREFAEVERVTAQERAVELAYEREVEWQITTRETKISRLEAATSEDSSKGAHLALMEQRSILGVVLQASIDRRQTSRAHIETMARNLRATQADVNAIFEESFVGANLLEPATRAEPPVEENDDDKDERGSSASRPECREEQDGACVTPIKLGETGIEHLMSPPLSPGAQMEADLRGAYWAAQQHVAEAQRSFDQKDAERNAQREAAREEVANDPAAMEAFDLRWLSDYLAISHELVAAEAAVEAALTALDEAGVSLGDFDQAPGMDDGGGVGYDLSSEHDTAIVLVPSSKIGRWLVEVVHGEVLGSISVDEAELNAGQNEALVGFNESLSVIDGLTATALVAKGADRKRIDVWQAELKLLGFRV